MAQGSQELAISKDDTDLIFSLDKEGWEKYAEEFEHPGSEVRLASLDTGTLIMAYDHSSGVALAIQPLYKTDQDLPQMLIVGNYFPLDTTSIFDDGLKEEIKSSASKDLGTKYSVTVKISKTERWQKVQVYISKKAE